MQVDPRLCSRFPHRAHAVLIHLPHLYEVTLIDISEHGVLVEPKGNVGIAIGDQTRLRVLTEKGNQAFEVEAIVAHRSEQGIGLDINSIDHHARNSLRRLVEAKLGTEELASRTLPVLIEANFSAGTARAGCA